jgi:ribosomal protein L37AE/L43A
MINTTTPAEIRAAKVLGDMLDLPTPAELRVAKVLGDMLDLPTPAELRVAKVLGDMLDLPTPAEIRAAKVLGDMLEPIKKKYKCSFCGEIGHNKRTCKKICSPCTETITFANGEKIDIDLGHGNTVSRYHQKQYEKFIKNTSDGGLKEAFVEKTDAEENEEPEETMYTRMRENPRRRRFTS